MKHFKKITAIVAGLAALALGGAAIAGATGGGDEDGDRDDGPDVVVTGAKADRAGAAASSATGGGTALSVEESDEGGRAAYEVKVNKDGRVHEVQVSDDYDVVGTELDDDQPGE